MGETLILIILGVQEVYFTLIYLNYISFDRNDIKYTIILDWIQFAGHNF